MSYRRSALFFSGVILGLVIAIGGSFYVGQAFANRNLGPYVISEHSNPTATAGVFRINVNTGYVSYCYLDAAAKPQVTCTPETP